MPRTIFETPLLQGALHALSVQFFKLKGWRLQGSLPEQATRSVLIAAPHTSNWDMPYTLLAAFALRLHIRWMGKASLFRPPFGPVMRWLGGIAVDRSRSNSLVSTTAQALREATGPLQLVLAPEGTRGRTQHWKTGFYFIALEAQVPIVLVFLDYSQKVAGIGPVFQPSGDVEADMAEIKRFYAGIKGRRADLFQTD